MLSDNDTMKLYMQNIGQYPLISPEEEAALIAKSAQGDNEAKSKLIKSNLGLVVTIAQDFMGRGLLLQDLISEGNIGLMRAVDKFDPSKGAKFSCYAAWWIKQSILQTLANQSKTNRIILQVPSRITKVREAERVLTEKLGREPTEMEIAMEVNLSVRTVKKLRQGKTATISLHDPIQHGEDGEFHGIIPDDRTPATDETI